VAPANSVAQKHLHLQRPGRVPGTYRNLCGNGNHNPAKNKGEPRQDGVFLSMLQTHLYRCCASCVVAAIREGIVTVRVKRAESAA
jgi:hypothetical protein